MGPLFVCRLYVEKYNHTANLRREVVVVGGGGGGGASDLATSTRLRTSMTFQI